MKIIFSVVFFLSITSGLLAQKISPQDEGSKVKFVINNFGIGTGGTFTGLAGSIVYDPANPTGSAFDVTVDASTIDTDIEGRDNHLRKSEYFDVKNHPRISFKSTRITKTNDPAFLYMFGNVTIKGITKEVKFPFSVTAKNGGYLFAGSFPLNRRDFNLGGRSLSLADELQVELSVFAK
jgi:polyisoprenoid-binding protein YceI